MEGCQSENRPKGANGRGPHLWGSDFVIDRLERPQALQGCWGLAKRPQLPPRRKRDARGSAAGGILTDLTNVTGWQYKKGFLSVAKTTLFVLVALYRFVLGINAK